ncbi:MAG TPA: carbamoyltransferase HypF [Dehalococcoidia bacterium]|nr:carbamoyltransferase HypF [Dehalococcoidia bacterium]
MRNASPELGSVVRLRVKVHGVVQGVGFRPFIYRLAHRSSLNGWVRNTSGNVTIEIEGREMDIERFIGSLKDDAPPVAHISDVATETIAVKGDSGFTILESKAKTGEYQPVSGDIATCSECLKDIFDPGNRRYLYPFTNCTNCGPRFTIIRGIPYDRPLTTMNRFIMCPDCQAEYDDPLNRRFHAQPNACPKCGPSLLLADREGNAVACCNVLKKAAGLLKEGNIIAIKGIGGFQLACDATNSDVVVLLRKRKRRPGKPFALMMASIDEIKKHCMVSPDEKGLLLSAQSPIVLLRWQRDVSNIAEGVAERNKYLGIMLPSTPLHHILLRYTGIPLVMTSGNISEEPICKDNNEAMRRLEGIDDYFVLHDRDIYSRYDDGVYLVERNEVRALRRARGHAPSPIKLPFTSRQIMACGADEKNTFCLTRDKYAFLSQHIGDMDNEETLEHYEDTIKLYRRLFCIEPEVIAHDMHPEYRATRYALRFAAEKGLPTVAVQHHHAHIVSCMVENNVSEPVIGIAFDGTGYGRDGNIWGGEFLVCDAKGFERIAHLEYIPMPGGDSAIRKPYRMALGYLLTLLGKEIPLKNLPVISRIPAEEVVIIKKQIEQRFNAPLTSSAGRLFDAVSALAGVRGEIEYEAQAAIELEMLAPDDISNLDAYPFTIEHENGILLIRLKDLIAAIVSEVASGVPATIISGRFHRTVARIIVNTCCIVSERRKIKSVALSGGVFQNRLLLNLAIDELEKEGFRVYSHRIVPANDGCIALGQAAIAHFS